MAEEPKFGESALFAPIEPYVQELAWSEPLPSMAVSLCTLRYPDCAHLLRAALQRAADGELEGEEDERLFFRALFIIGGRRDPLGFEPLMRLLRAPQDEVEFLLGDAITEHLAKIVAGVFNGDHANLFEGILDRNLDEYVRDAMLGAATFLTWQGSIDRQRFVDLLERLHMERAAPDGSIVWYAWLRAVALLGLRQLQPLVFGAWDRLPEQTIEREEFSDLLARAECAPEDIGLFHDEHLGYIDDVLDALMFFGAAADPLLDAADDWTPPTPAVNPWRHVGRNDPCPCGSGKKAKRCCLAA